MNFLSLIFIGISLLMAQNSGLPLLNNPAGTETMALASANGAKSSSGFEFNPSRFNSESRGFLSYHSGVEDFRFYHLGFQSVSNRFLYGVVFKYQDSGVFEHRGNSPEVNPIGTFKNVSNVLKLALAYNYTEHFTIGVLYGMNYQKLFHSEAHGNSWNIGINYRTEPFDTFLSLENIGRTNRLKEKGSPLPTLINAGVLYRWNLIELGLETTYFLDEDKWNGKLHCRWNVFKNVAILGGFQSNDTEKPLSFGMSFSHTTLTLAYAYVPHKSLNDIQSVQFSLAL